MNLKKLGRNVILLSLVSFFTDLSSEMIYPLIPGFLTSLGASKSLIGIIEGIAEATASLFRTVFGGLSDRFKKRKLFIFLGYAFSAFSKPFLYFAHAWPTVLGVRFADRTGKAIRTPARDALLSTSVDPSIRGAAFGFNRAFDRMGAIGGPLLAMLVLSLANQEVRWVFLASFVPAVVALIFILFAKETAAPVAAAKAAAPRGGLRNPSFILFLISIVVFTLGNSSNAFLILKAQEAGLPVGLVPVIWIVYSIVCTLSSPVFGHMSDRVGKRPIIVISFLYYAAVYAGFAFASSLWIVWVLFGLYGIYYGLSEGVFRAYIADLVPAEQRATAYGILNTGIGLALLPASLLTGAVWDAFGSKWALLVSSAFSLLGFLIFIIALPFSKRKEQSQ